MGIGTGRGRRALQRARRSQSEEGVCGTKGRERERKGSGAMPDSILVGSGTFGSSIFCCVGVGRLKRQNSG